MLDYVPTEIVAYADTSSSDIFSYDYLYPDPLKFNGSTSKFQIYKDNYLLYYTVSVPFDFTPADYDWNSNVSSNSVCWKITFVGYSLYVNGTYSDYYTVDYNYSGYYFDKGVDDGSIIVGEQILYRCPFDLTPNKAPNINAGSDIEFLYNIGSSVVELGSGINGILNYEVAGNNIMSLIFSSTIFIYIGWTVAKWLIPL